MVSFSYFESAAIATLPGVATSAIDTTEVPKIAALRLQKRFTIILSSACEIEHVSEKDTANSKNCFLQEFSLLEKRILLKGHCATGRTNYFKQQRISKGG